MKKITGFFEKNKDNLDLINIFIWVSIVSVLLTVLFLRLSGGTIFSNLFFKDSMDSGMDFFHSIEYTVGRAPYELFGTLYPPLANLLFYVILQFVPEWEKDKWASTFTEGVQLRGTSADLRIWQPTFLLFLFFVIICVIWSFYLFKKTIHLEDKKTFAAVCLLFSYGLLYAMERGNIIIISAFCVIIFIKNRNSDDRIQQEVALIALAIAAGLKLYPAVFGLLLLYDRQYKKALRTMLYGIIAFFVPFLFFKEGLNGMGIFWSVLNSHSGTSVFSGSGTSVDKIMNTVIVFFANVFRLEINESLLISILPCLNVIVSCMILAMGFWMKKEWERILACSLAITLYQSQGVYLLIFLMAAFVFFLRDEKKLTTENFIPFIGMMAANLLLPLPLYSSSNMASAQYIRIQFCLVILIAWFVWKFVCNVKTCTAEVIGYDYAISNDRSLFDHLSQEKKTVLSTGDRYVGNILRCLATLFVFLLHGRSYTACLDNVTGFWNWITKFPAWAGVWIFIFLSGYGIGYGFCKQKYSLKDEDGKLQITLFVKFYLGRFVKIAPIYYAYCILFDCISGNNFFWYHPDIFLKMTIFGFNGNGGVSGLGHLWYVSLAMQLYLVMPFVYLIIDKIKSNKKLLMLSYGIIVFAGCAMRLISINLDVDWYNGVYTKWYMNLDLVISGMLIAAMKEYYQFTGLKQKRKTILRGISFILLGVLVIYNNYIYYVGSFSLLEIYRYILPTAYIVICSVLFIAGSEKTKKENVISNVCHRWTDFFSKYSFSFYIFSIIGLKYMGMAMEQNYIYNLLPAAGKYLMFFGVAFMITLLAAIVFDKMVRFVIGWVAGKYKKTFLAEISN